MRRPTPRPSVRGFTLVELLTVIAITGILAALLIVSIRGLVKRADQSTCASNMRAVGQATLLYAADHKGRLPPLQNSSELPSPNSFANVIPSYLGATGTSYADDPSKLAVTRQIMRCPSQRKTILEASGMSSEMELDMNQLRGFGMNAFLGPTSNNPTNWRTLASIDRPSKTWLLSESGLAISGDKMSCIGVMDVYWIGQSTLGADGKYQRGVHGASNNILWVDGHLTSWTDITRLQKAPYHYNSTENLWTGR